MPCSPGLEERHERPVVLGPVWHLCPFVPGDDPFPDHAASLPPDRERARAGIAALAVEATRRGVLAFPRPARGYLRGYLSLAHTEGDLEASGERLGEALRACRRHFA